MLAHHAPAVKVGGRRLSISSKPKPATVQEPQVIEEPVEPTDYPRPAPPNEQEDVRDEDKKKQGYGNNERERKRIEVGHKKVEDNMPTKDFGNQPKDRGAGGRIAQPAGKGLSV